MAYVRYNTSSMLHSDFLGDMFNSAVLNYI